MAYTIKVTYKKPETVELHAVPEICNVFKLDGAAADLTAFDDTWYDTNVYGENDTEWLEKFVADQVAHPGLVAALRKAKADAEASENGEATVTFTTDNAKHALYMGEVAKAVEPSGFTIEVEQN